MFNEKEIKTLLLSDEETFLRLVEEISDRISSGEKELPEWIDEKSAMEILHIRSKTTLAKLRNSGAITYSAISSKHYLYSRTSILEFIESKQQSTF